MTMITENLQNFIESINEFTEEIFSPLDNAIEALHLADWLEDAFIDSLHLLPLLFLVFLFIEIIEFFFANKMHNFIKKLEFSAVTLGAIAAVIPQCGFSVIASTLYIKKFITKGTLISIYLATSDEAVPVLLTDSQAAGYVIPIISIKILIAIIFGYLLILY